MKDRDEKLDSGQTPPGFPPIEGNKPGDTRTKRGRPPTANRTRKFADAVTKGKIDGRSSIARAMRRFKAEMRAELNFEGWSKAEDLDLRLAASFFGRLVRAEEYLGSH